MINAVLNVANYALDMLCGIAFALILHLLVFHFFFRHRAQLALDASDHNALNKVLLYKRINGKQRCRGNHD